MELVMDVQYMVGLVGLTGKRIWTHPFGKTHDVQLLLSIQNASK